MNASQRSVPGPDSRPCVEHLPCFSESCVPPCSSIWFNFGEMFIFPSKYPFITLGMELHVLLVRTGQIMGATEGLLLRPCIKQTQR